MDSLITAAGRALAAGDPFGALNRVALRNDAPALAIRGIAMAQLGDLARARTLVRAAARAFGPKEPLARARCRVAEAEIAFAARDLAASASGLEAAWQILEAHDDRANAGHARLLDIRRRLLIGEVDAAERALDALDAGDLSPASRTIAALVRGGLAMRRLDAGAARIAFTEAAAAARQARIPTLIAEVDAAGRLLVTPAARLISQGKDRPILLDEVDTLRRTAVLLVDACRSVARQGEAEIALARRPVLFTLLRAMAEAWPLDVPRDALITRAFRGKQADESHRARLRVEIGRLRAVIRPVAEVRSTRRGFTLAVPDGTEVAVLAHPIEEPQAAVLALLSDGEQWSSGALAVALGSSQRTVQRALDGLCTSGKVEAFGRGRARRWMAAPLPGFTTTLLLPALMQDG
ncbi:helix-turn-helix domain-containing protein [Segnochrobactrum spirostomi]|uniref:Helix-turn-helix domain-containing protein n=1 Tax=Segnochrobactrum spirostomi TaxID=2608987 RepID=A0A6A7Y9Z3_9HYPH|nr:helix-turn-helix domain-containing protein [Segnochrobactrum spirostomi]MQT15187.1 helix-turn-helix domain-containing protein [Segnochrobactrum spirostomi]